MQAVAEASIAPSLTVSFVFYLRQSLILAAQVQVEMHKGTLQPKKKVNKQTKAV